MPDSRFMRPGILIVVGLMAPGCAAAPSVPPHAGMLSPALLTPTAPPRERTRLHWRVKHRHGIAAGSRAAGTQPLSGVL